MELVHPLRPPRGGRRRPLVSPQPSLFCGNESDAMMASGPSSAARPGQAQHHGQDPSLGGSPQSGPFAGQAARGKRQYARNQADAYYGDAGSSAVSQDFGPPQGFQGSNDRYFSPAEGQTSAPSQPAVDGAYQQQPQFAGPHQHQRVPSRYDSTMQTPDGYPGQQVDNMSQQFQGMGLDQRPVSLVAAP